MFDILLYRDECGQTDLGDRELVAHYVAQGWRQGRRPNRWFDPGWYLEQYPDVERQDGNPFVHFLDRGMFERRRPGPIQAASPEPGHRREIEEPRAPRAVSRGVERIVFVSHAPFDSNSGGHIAYFANGLASIGYDVAVVAPGDISKAFSYGVPNYEYMSVDSFTKDPESVVNPDRLPPSSLRLVAWSPREVVRRAVEPVAQRYGIPFIVHLEDNEQHLAEAFTSGRPQKADTEEFWAHPERAGQFLASAAGVTGITERLAELAPAGRPFMVLSPGVDSGLFQHAGRATQRKRLRRALGLSPEATLLAYCGNVHRANACEVATLYNAVAIVRARGFNLWLVRTGIDTVRELMFSADLRAMEGVIPLGFVDRSFLAALVQSADVFVQPGAPGPFNDYRIPSKLPEFLATGRPVILPRTNIGLDLVHGESALLLEGGSPVEIADRLEDLLTDPSLGDRVGAGGRAYALGKLRWDVQSSRLASFLEMVGASSSDPRPALS